MHLVSALVSYPRVGIEAHGPEDPKCFHEAAELELEVSDDFRTYSARFQCVVMTPQWVVRELDRVPAVWGAAGLIVAVWDTAVIARALRAQVDLSGHRNWASLVTRLTHVFGPSPDALDPEV